MAEAWSFTQVYQSIMSFLSNLMTSGYQTQKELDESMRARVAETSINGQRLTDDFFSPDETVGNVSPDPRISDLPMFGYAHSDVKNSEIGTRSTFLAAKEYVNEAKKRRDELLARYAVAPAEGQQ